MKLAYVRSVSALEQYQQADSYYKRARIAMDFFEKELPIVIEEMKKKL